MSDNTKNNLFPSYLYRFYVFISITPLFHIVLPFLFIYVLYRRSAPLSSLVLMNVKTVHSPSSFRSSIPLSPSLLSSVFLSHCSNDPVFNCDLDRSTYCVHGNEKRICGVVPSLVRLSFDTILLRLVATMVVVETGSCAALSLVSSPWRHHCH